jgi:hypothetical protein
MDQDSIVVVVIEGVTSDVGATIDQQHRAIQLAGQSLGQDAPGESRTNNKMIEHLGLFSIFVIVSEGNLNRGTDDAY